MAQTAVYTNSSPITILDNTTAGTYSSNINVSGFTGTITDIGVVIKNFTHGAPADVAMCLEAPSGEKLLIQEQMWGAPSSDVTYMLSDLGTTQVGIYDLPSNGTYKPTANSGLVSFNAPGPGTSYNNPGPSSGGSATMNSTFGTATANGVWKLWVVDISGGDAGMINGGWELQINPSTVLPVSLANFRANCESDNILAVNWTTYNEENSKSFTIEVSPDGSFFEGVKTISASGNSQVEMTYKAAIAMPYAQTFVRIELTDLNGNPTYSKVLETKCGNDLPYKISPNPVDEYFVIDNPGGEFMRYELTDVNGQVILKGNSKSVHHRVEIGSSVSAGTYFLHLKTVDGDKNFKVNVR